MSLNSIKEVKFPVSVQNIHDQVAALFYATGRVHDDEEVAYIQFGDVSKTDDGNEIVEITLGVRKEKKQVNGQAQKL